MEKNSEILKDNPSNGLLRNMARRLTELEEEKKALFQISGDAILVVHPFSGEIYDANQHAAQLIGYTVSALLTMRLDEIIPGHEVLEKILSFQQSNGSKGAEAKLRRSDGSSVLVSMTSSFAKREQKSVRLVFLRKKGTAELNGRSFAGNGSANGKKDNTEPTDDFPNIIGKSEKTRRICQLIGQVACTDSTVLIQGESGTGKEIVAQAIHFHSARSKNPFVKVNCAALTETLLESELFGHVKGAFTGALRDRNGRFRQADGGTILLDEIASMSLSGQAKLLRVLEEREFEPVGTSSTISVNVRVVAACNAELEKAAALGKFREDLFYRLNVFSISMPTLREKKEDIPLLARHFLHKYNLAINKDLVDFSPEALTLMMQYDWPGNVRELENAIEHAVILAKNQTILPADLPSNLFSYSPEVDPDLYNGLSLRDRLNHFEKQIILDALSRTNGVKKDAAALLKIDPRNFPYLLKKHKLAM